MEKGDQAEDLSLHTESPSKHSLSPLASLGTGFASLADKRHMAVLGGPPTSRHFEHRSGFAPAQISTAAAAAAAALGTVVLLGWVFDVAYLKGPIPSIVQMKLNTSLGLIALGGSLLATMRATTVSLRVASVLAALAMSIGVAVLFEYLLGVNLGVDELFARDTSGIQTIHPGRLAPQTALAFICLGAAILLLGRSRSRPLTVDLLAALSFSVSLLAVLGYAYGASTLNQLPSLTPMALHTAIACLLLSLAVAGRNRDGFVLGALEGSNTGSVTARRLLLLIIVGVPLIGWFRLKGQEIGLYPRETGVALFVVATVALLATTVVFLARSSNKFDEERKKLRVAEHRLATLVETAEEAIFSIDSQGAVSTWNGGAERMYGYSSEEVIGEPITVLNPPDLADEGAETLRKVLTGEPFVAQTRRRRKDGAVIDVKLTATPIFEGGALVGVGSCTHDIGDQLRAKELLETRVAERTAELAHARQETLARLALAAEFRDDDTARHTERVGWASAAAARRLGLPEDFVRLLGLAAPLHDVGKIGVSDGILLKPAKLTPEEFETMKQHTVLGAELLSGSDSEVLQLAEELALSHHERWDGGGYPSGLAGDEIPLAGRIVAVADSFDAMTNDRPYKDAIPIAAALAELDRCSGTQFDPSVVRAFVDSFKEAPAPLDSQPHVSPLTLPSIARV